MAEITLQLGDFTALAAMLAGFGTVAVMLVQGNIKGLVGRIVSAEHRITKVEEKQGKKVDKHDWARETILQRGKMERIGGQLERVDAKLDSNFGLAAQVGRLVDELKQSREKRHDQ